MVTGKPKVLKYERAIKSALAFDAEYGDEALSPVHSVKNKSVLSIGRSP